MKLYATMKNERRGKKGMGDDRRILIELAYGNKIIGEIGLYAIIDEDKEGYRIVWNHPDNGFNPDTILREEEKDKRHNEKRQKHDCGYPEGRNICNCL